MRPITEEKHIERINYIQKLFDQKYSTHEIIELNLFPRSLLKRYLIKHNFNVFYKCKECGTTENLKKYKGEKLSDICISCYVKNKQIKLNETVKKKRQQRFIDKENNKQCRICGTKENLAIVKKKGVIYKKNICKKCLSSVYIKSNKSNWDNMTHEQRKERSRKTGIGKQEHWKNLSEKEKNKFKEKVSNGIINWNNNRTDKEKQQSIDKGLKTRENWTPEKKKKFSKKISNAWKNKPQEEIDARSKKTFETKQKKGTFNDFQVFGYGKKAQKLFWFLDDNLPNYNPIYATHKTRDTNNPQNNEFCLYTKNLNETNSSFRKLDFYLKLHNGIELCIEFDENAHKRQINEDLLRETELFKIRPNMLVLRVREADYDSNSEYVKNTLLNIIINLERTKSINWSIIPDILRPISYFYSRDIDKLKIL